MHRGTVRKVFVLSGLVNRPKHSCRLQKETVILSDACYPRLSECCDLQGGPIEISAI